MKWPFFLSKTFWYLKDLPTEDVALEALNLRPMDHRIAFFIEAAEDATWIQGGGVTLMGKLFAAFQQAYREGTLKGDKVIAIARAIQSQYKALAPAIERDVDFVVGDEVMPISRILFSAESNFFRDLIYGIKAASGQRPRIVITKINPRFFKYIMEFVTTAQIEFLWREEPTVLIDFIRQAKALGMDPMTAFAANVYKRYLDRQNVLEIVKLAQNEGIKPLEESCCHYINESSFGLQIDFRQGVGLEMTISFLMDEGKEIVERLTKQVAYLHLKGSAASDADIVPWIKKIPRLALLDLQETTGISTELLEAFPAVKFLNLCNCPWLDDDQFLRIIKRAYQVKSLDLSYNENLTFRAWGGLSSLQKITSLTVNYCRQIGDDEIDLIASSLPRLLELQAKGVSFGDAGLLSLSKFAPSLISLDLEGCRAITYEGLFTYAASNRSLRHLNLGDCRNLDELVLKQLLELLPELEYFNISGCDVSPEFEQMVRSKWNKKS